MKKNSLCIFAVTAMLVASATTSMADNPILTSLKSKGVTLEMMNDASLDSVRGTSLIYGQPLPSTTTGYRSHHVTYKGFGSGTDYRSYNYVGSAFTPGQQIIAEGYVGFGDTWDADTVSSPNSWSAAYAQTIEYHVQILYQNGTLSPYAARATAWNRPITTFIW